MRDWQQQDILKQDSARALYLYHQEFEVEGRTYTRKGFLGRVRLEPFGQGRIYPHEETLAGPKADRLKLFQATAMNLSPVFGLYPDDDGAVQACLEETVRRAPPLEATDHLGVVSRLWPVTDQHAVSLAVGLMGPKPVFIADGHHRYETGLRYLALQREAGLVKDDEAAANFILMMLVSISDPGLIILPTHRLVSGLPGLSADRLRTLLGSAFEVKKIGTGDQAACAAWEAIVADGGQNLLGFGTTADGVWQTARFRDPALMTLGAPDRKPSVAQPGREHLACRGAGSPSEAGRDEPAQLQVCASVERGHRCGLREEVRPGGLAPPADMKHVEQIAGGLEKMPPKSTYFYPKLLSGLLFNPLTGS